MITVVIPTLNAEAGLAACMTALVSAVVSGLVREVIVVDGGSTDRTRDIAEQAGCTIIHAAKPNRGQQMIDGAAAARHPWLLFLHADTILDDGWAREASAFIERVDARQRPPAAAAFSLALDDLGFKPRLIEAGVALRCMLLRLPYGDQGLLIPRALYQKHGGFRPLALMEDVDLICRLPRAQRIIFRTKAVTSAIRYKRDGYLLRVARNLSCLALYLVHVPIPTIQRLYRG